jgi:hypothetical protein
MCTHIDKPTSKRRQCTSVFEMSSISFAVLPENSGKKKAPTGRLTGPATPATFCNAPAAATQSDCGGRKECKEPVQTFFCYKLVVHVFYVTAENTIGLL